MKRNWMKKAIGLGLAAAMTVNLAACGKENGKNANNELAKQCVYSYQDIELGLEEFEEGYDIMDMSYHNDKVYLLVNTYGYEEGTAGEEAVGGGAIEPRASVTSEAVAVEEGAAEGAAPEEEGAAEGAAPEEEGTAAESVAPEEEGAAEGEAVEGEAAVEEDVAVLDEGIADMEVYPEVTGVWKSHTWLVSSKLDGSDKTIVELPTDSAEGANVSIYNTAFGSDGSVYAVKDIYIEDYSDPENPIYENWQEIGCWAADGTVKWNLSVDDFKGDSEYAYVNNLMAGSDGSLYMMVGSEVNKLVAVDTNGKVISQKEMKGADFENAGSIYLKPDGSLLVMTYNNDWTKSYMFTYDVNTDTAGEKVELPGTINMYSMFQGDTTDFILSNNIGVYTYNVGDAEPVQVMNYINSDLAANYMGRVKMIDDQHFIGMYNDTIDYETRVAYFTKVDPKDVPDKEVIVLGANSLDSDVRQRVIDFNKTNTKYRITVRDYSTYNTMEDYMAGNTQLNNDIVAGNMPDILMTYNYMPIENYISKGLIADIGKLIEKDEELSQAEYMQNVFDAFSLDGKLYYLVPSFTVETVMAKSSLVGEEPGWTMEEMQKILAGMPEGTSSFGEMDRSSFFYTAMNYCGSDYIDVASGKCNFESPEFINLLEFAKTLPEEIDYSQMYGEDFDWNEYELQYRNERTLLMPTGIYQVRNLNYTIKGQFGEDVTFIGFPNANSNGSIINANMSFVLSAKSKVTEGAWEFVRYYLTDEYQTGDEIWGMPVKKDAFMELANEATQRPYWEDENGEKVEYDDTYYINGEEIIIPPMTQEEVDEIVAFIETVNRRSYYNEDITDIIAEEAAPFYDGQKSAAEAAQIIQSRAQIYVNENR